MPTEKISLSLDESLVIAARAQVGPRGLSSYVNQALRFQLQRDRLIQLLDDLEEEVGPIVPKVMSEVRKSWPAPVE